MRPLEHQSPEWEDAWQKLAAALRDHPLPTEKTGVQVACSLNDFMLMGAAGDGTLLFKCIVTRNYLHVRPDGTLEIPTEGMNRLGFFASMSQ